jgi:hypothetical protein
VLDRETPPPSDRDRRAAQVAHVLARAVRDGELVAADALRILRHELRRRNTNQALNIATRSAEAQRVIDEYGAANVPKNESPDALHADHVYPLTEDELRRNDTLELWINQMQSLQTVVCVTAKERLDRTPLDLHEVCLLREGRSTHRSKIGSCLFVSFGCRRQYS